MELSPTTRGVACIMSGTCLKSFAQIVGDNSNNGLRKCHPKNPLNGGALLNAFKKSIFVKNQGSDLYPIASRMQSLKCSIDGSPLKMEKLLL
jgi:hypothetical protein